MSDAKPLTTKDVDGLDVAPEYEMESAAIVDREDLLATTRALETALGALKKSEARASEESARAVRALRAEADLRHHSRDAIARLSYDLERERERCAELVAAAAKTELDIAAEKARVDGLASTFDELGTGYLARAEKAEREVVALRANFILIADAAGNEDPTTSHHAVRRLRAERDDARTKLASVHEELIVAEGNHCVDREDHAAEIAKLRRERDAARARIYELEAALLDACREKVVHGHTTTLWTEAKRLEVPGLHELQINADQLRSEHKTLVAELVTALEGLFVEYDHLRSAGSKYALTYWVDRLPDHACAECVPGGPIVAPGFRCREHSARAALAKAKGATNG